MTVGSMSRGLMPTPRPPLYAQNALAGGEMVSLDTSPPTLPTVTLLPIW